MDWITEYPVAIKACDINGVLVYLNDTAAEKLAGKGGRKLIGQDIFRCHKPESQKKLALLMKTGGTNCYTIIKQGQKSLVYQAPWVESGVIKGMVEMTIELPDNLPNYLR